MSNSSKFFATLLTGLLCAPAPSALAQQFKITGTKGTALNASEIASFDNPWAMTFLPGETMLVTTKPGDLWVVDKGGNKTRVRNLPKPTVGNQGGLGDVVPHPDFAENKLIYLSYVESTDGGNTRGAVVIRGKLELGEKPKLIDIERIWTQQPKTRGGGHFSHRIVFGPEGSTHEGKLFITSGDRQALSPAQDWDKALGKLIRLNHDGSVPSDNPFQNNGDLAKSFWSTGHRNSLGIAFDRQNRLWAHEMGPRHGDELNLIVPGKNYGWPIVSEGDHYSGVEIPDHNTRPEFEAPKAAWVPSIAPSGLIIYSGNKFPNWKGNAFIGGLASNALIRVSLGKSTAREAERFEWGKRIREVEQEPNGYIWVLEDRGGGRLLKLAPRK